jgi:hypothetical protein
VRTKAAGSEGAIKVEVVDSGPARETIKVSSSTSPFILVLGQQYDQGWKMMFENGEVTGGLEGRVPLAGQTIEADEAGESCHFSVDGGLNAWYVDPQELLTGDPDGENADGTLDLELVLEFCPQRQARWGSMLSLLTILGIIALAVGVLIARGRARLKKRRAG